MVRIRRIDLVKGGLIVLVIIGHVLPGGFHASLARWIIYSFHMPVFVAVSGYLFPWEKIAATDFADLARKYWRRPVLPWLVAMAVYSAIDNAPGSLLSARWWAGYIGHFIRPFFHLWYVAAYLFWVLLSWGLLRLRLNMKWILLVGVLLSVLYAFERYLYTLHPDYYLFFVLGGFLRRYSLGMPRWLGILLVLTLFAAEVVLFYQPHQLLETVVFYELNVCLIWIMVLFMTGEGRVGSRLLEWMGEQSLPIYLWHVIPLMIVVRLHLATEWAALLLKAGLMAVLFWIVWLSTRPRATQPVRRMPR